MSIEVLSTGKMSTIFYCDISRFRSQPIRFLDINRWTFNRFLRYSALGVQHFLYVRFVWTHCAFFSFIFVTVLAPKFKKCFLCHIVGDIEISCHSKWLGLSNDTVGWAKAHIFFMLWSPEGIYGFLLRIAWSEIPTRGHWYPMIRC